MIYDLLPDTHFVLHLPSEPFDFENPPIDPVELAQNLAETMIEHKGIGLAAPQCGLSYSVLVFGNPDDKDSIVAMFNPKIVYESEEKVRGMEGCLSFPELYIQIKRAESVRVRFQDCWGNTATQIYSGLTARVVQHEIDHLHGITFTKVASKSHLLKAKQEKKKRMRMK